jgi:hypothetical protein
MLTAFTFDFLPEVIPTQERMCKTHWSICTPMVKHVREIAVVLRKPTSRARFERSRFAHCQSRRVYDAEILKFIRTRLDDVRQISDNRYELLLVGPLLATGTVQTRGFESDHSGIDIVPGSAACATMSDKPRGTCIRIIWMRISSPRPAEWKCEELQEAMNQDMLAGVYFAGTRATCPSKEEEIAEFASRHSNHMPE